MFIKIFTLLLLVLAGFWLRLINTSPHKFYPDSYVSLVVAANITNYGGVWGFLGDKGMLYPDIFFWTRPIFPLFIAIFSSKSFPPDQTARSITLLAGVLSIPVIYFLIKSLSDSRLTASIGAGLLTISFNHIVWGGFILSESIGVFFLLLFLWSFFSSLKQPTGWANTRDLLTGLIFATSVLSRYEYLVLALPLFIFILAQNGNRLIRLVNISAGFLLFSSLISLSLIPMQGMIMELFSQIIYEISPGLWIGAAAISIALFFFARKFKFKTQVMTLIIFFIGAVFLLQITLRLKTDFHFYPGLTDFFQTDFLIAITSWLGLYTISKFKLNQHLFIFLSLSLLLLGLVYYQVNPAMQRYGTHLIPFLVIPGAFWIRSIKRPIWKAALVSLAVAQLIYSAFGIKKWGGGEWFKVSYEEKSAKILSSMPIGDTVLFTSFPDAYYLYTHRPTHSIIDRYPFIYPDRVSDEDEVAIVQDQGMRDIFPLFSSQLDTHLSKYKIIEYRVNEIYHYRTKSEHECCPVKVYKLSLAELKSVIENFAKRP